MVFKMGLTTLWPCCKMKNRLSQIFTVAVRIAGPGCGLSCFVVFGSRPWTCSGLFSRGGLTGHVVSSMSDRGVPREFYVGRSAHTAKSHWPAAVWATTHHLSPQSATLLCAFREEMTVTATRIVAKIRRLAAGSMSVAMLYGKRDSALRCAWPARRVNLRLCEPWLLDDFPASGMKLRSSEADRQSAETNA